MAGGYNVKSLIGAIVPFVSSANWYVRTYICFFFFIPFINELLLTIDKKKFTQLIVLISMLYFALNTIVMNRFAFDGLYFMFNYYVFGAYFRLYGNKSRDNKLNLLISLICSSLMIMSSVIPVAFGYVLKSESLLFITTPFASYSNILSFGFSYFLFVYFANKEFTSKAINLVASTTLSIYMLHDRGQINQLIWCKWFPNVDYVNNPYLHSITKILCVFLVCMLIDLLRQLTLNKLFKKTVYKKIDEILDKIISWNPTENNPSIR